MAIVLDTNDLLNAGAELLPEAEFSRLSAALIGAAQDLALRLAAHEGVTHVDTSHEPDFGGLCATFVPGPCGKVSDAIGAYDGGGEWAE